MEAADLDKHEKHLVDNNFIGGYLRDLMLS